VWLVGAEFQKTNAPFRTFADVEEVKQELTRHQPEGMTILIKGSNSTHLYELPPLL
jgi:UDP-N-acetylmuramoyl-tripeptide--D-alanyl-D-alanine ligase